MGKETTISWTDVTWNIAVGCTKVDEDCRYCYMYRDSMQGSRYNPREIRRTKGVFDLPLKIKKPSKIFTCSLTDFFHPEIDAWRHEAWEIIRKCPHHIFQILTKRPERITMCLPEFWSEIRGHVWIGTSVGSQEGIDRIRELMQVDSDIRFISFEPLHTEIDLGDFSLNELKKIHWVIIGGESGNETGLYRYRPFHPAWAASIMAQFRAAQPGHTAFFLKQVGTFWAKRLKLKGDRHGQNASAWPFPIVYRDFPDVDHPAMRDDDYTSEYAVIGVWDGPIILKSK